MIAPAINTQAIQGSASLPNNNSGTIMRNMQSSSLCDSAIRVAVPPITNVVINYVQSPIYLRNAMTSMSSINYRALSSSSNDISDKSNFNIEEFKKMQKEDRNQIVSKCKPSNRIESIFPLIVHH